jgi:hypothetical protein
MHPLKIGLTAKEDTDRQVFYVGKLELPMSLNFFHGITFVIYTGKVNELHIYKTKSHEINDLFQYYSKPNSKLQKNKYGNIVLKLDTMYEEQDDGKEATIYVGNLEFDGKLDFDEGIAFLVFVSDEGEEELQIAKSDRKNKDKAVKR